MKDPWYIFGRNIVEELLVNVYILWLRRYKHTFTFTFTFTQHMRHVHRIYLEFFHIFRFVSALHIQ